MISATSRLAKYVALEILTISFISNLPVLENLIKIRNLIVLSYKFKKR